MIVGIRVDRQTEAKILALAGVQVGFTPASTETKRRASTPVQSEADFQAQVIQLATIHGWKCVHFPDSRRVSCPGWPDLVLGHQTRGVIFAELKREGRKPRPSQAWWCEVLSAAGCRVCVWRPGDWSEVVRVLAG